MEQSCDTADHGCGDEKEGIRLYLLHDDAEDIGDKYQPQQHAAEQQTLSADVAAAGCGA